MSKLRINLFRNLGLKQEQWIAISAFAVNAVINVIIVLIFGVGLVSYVFLVVGTTSTVLFDKINRHTFENKALEQLNKARFSIDDLECIGGISEGLDWTIRHMQGLQHVFNTVFTRSNEDYTSASQEIISRYTDAIRSALNNGCQWTDLYGSSQKHVIEAFRASLSPEQQRRYNSFEVPVHIPMFQYSVFGYTDRRRSVIFGWGFEGGVDDRAQVFISHGPRTVDFFLEHFYATRRLFQPDTRPVAAGSPIYIPQPS